MKKINKFCVTLILLITSFQILAQGSEVLCKDNYDLDTAVKELNASLPQMGNYSVSAPSTSISPGGHHTICVTVTKSS